MTDFHDWDDIRAELDDGDGDALTAERARTEAWVSAFRLAEENKRLGLTRRHTADLTEASNWREVKAKARVADPFRNDAERVARRRQMREQMLATVSRAGRLRDLQGANDRRLAELDVHAGDLPGLISEAYKD